MKKLIRQIAAFGIVGIISFFVDYGIFALLNNCFRVYYLIANVVSFSCSVIINYILNMKYVFQSDNHSDKRKEFVWYIVLNVIGLFINQCILKIMVDTLGQSPMFSKIISVGIVMVYNFISRKILLERKKN